jgi:hypothetical protein
VKQEVLFDSVHNDRPSEDFVQAECAVPEYDENDDPHNGALDREEEADGSDEN